MAANEKAPATPVYRAVMLLANSFHAPDGLVVDGEKRDAENGFVVAPAKSVVDIPVDHPVLAEVQMAVELGRAAPSN